MPRSFLLFILLPLCTSAQTVKFRKYKPGEIYSYKLTSESYRNDQLTGKSIAISEHKVITDAGFLSEEIRWLGKTSYLSGDTIKLDSIARKTDPYIISLSPGGKIPLPQLNSPEMVGEITDLNTFWVAVSPALNAQQLSPMRTVIVSKTIREGDFADSVRILYGKDCMIVTQALIATPGDYSVVATYFTPPLSFCLAPLLDTVAKKTFDEPNNFQMIQKGTGDKVNLFWGIESFTITTNIDNHDGRILEATMSNVLTLRMRYNSSKDLKTYDAELPVTIKRNLKLELLTE